LLRLEPMTEERFAAYLEAAIPECATDKVEAGTWLPEEAPQKSRAGVGPLRGDRIRAGRRGDAQIAALKRKNPAREAGFLRGAQAP
jgi:hypothetical protein